MVATLDFSLSADRIATRPSEVDGRFRDDVALLVSTVGGDLHRRFQDLPDLLGSGDLVVVNDSATLPAAVDVPDSDEVVHLSTLLEDGSRIVELRHRAGFGTSPGSGAEAGRRLDLPGGATVDLVAAWPDPAQARSRLWRALVVAPRPVRRWLAHHGHPVRYGDTAEDLPLSVYQTVFARRPGSSEMPSAARPLSPAVLDRLRLRGVDVVSITLHTGLSSPERHERPHPERFRVPAATAAAVVRAQRAGRRVIAVGTGVVRALETAATGTGRVVAAHGWTELVVSPQQPPRVVDGLLTGFHEPEASHVALLEAFAGTPMVERAYAAALDGPYRWHEFGDSHLLLPRNDRQH